MSRRVRSATLFVLILAVAILRGESVQAESVEDLDLRFDAGYRVDELDWNKAGGGVDVLSELEWEDLEIYQLRAAAGITIASPKIPQFDTHLRASAGYGWIVDGDNRDSDYDEPGRSHEFSRSENSADDGGVLDLSIGVGPQFRFRSDTLAITPLVGLSYHEQNLELSDGFQTVSEPGVFPTRIIIPPDVGPFAGLDSTYETEWSGPWVGFDAEWQPTPRLSLSGSAEYHWADYEAEGVWNLRTTGDDALAQDPSFEHEADGTGVVLSVAATYDVDDRWAVCLSGNFQDWQTDSGVDRTFFADGSAGATKLNEVNWESSAVNLGVVYRFF